MLMVTLGTGIGGGIVANSQIFHGESNFAGEIGHMVVNPFGPECSCGKKGCWERYASGSGLGRIGREAGLARKAPKIVELAGGDAESIKGEHIIASAQNGDTQAVEIIKEFSWWIALGLSNLANILDPKLIVIGGGVVNSHGVWLDFVREAFADLVEGVSVRDRINIEAAKFGIYAGAIGAGLFSAEEILI